MSAAIRVLAAATFNVLTNHDLSPSTRDLMTVEGIGVGEWADAPNERVELLSEILGEYEELAERAGNANAADEIRAIRLECLAVDGSATAAVGASETSTTLLALTEKIADVVGGGARGQIQNENGGAACAGFVAGCDSYDAFMFTAEVGGREYCVTVEDVTIKSDVDGGDV